jgi:hypothetical protein
MRMNDPTNNLTPTKQEQVVLILKGECPHNKGWVHIGYTNKSTVYQCKLCFVTHFKK